MQYQLAQVNIAKARAALDQPLMQGFVEQLEHINALAERSPGFVWRLKGDSGDATAIQLFDDPLIIVNLSLWQSVAALKDYVYSGEHLAVLRSKREWFDKLAVASLALWWVPAGQLPTLEQAKAALQSLQEHGATAQAFSFAQSFAPGDGTQLG